LGFERRDSESKNSFLARGESKPERRSGERIIAGTAFRLEFQVRLYVFAFLFLLNSHFLLCRKQNILQKNECAASENESNTVRPVATGSGVPRASRARVQSQFWRPHPDLSWQHRCEK